MNSESVGADRYISELLERFGHFHPHTGFGDVDQAAAAHLGVPVAVLPRQLDRIGTRGTGVTPDIPFTHYRRYNTPALAAASRLRGTAPLNYIVVRYK